MSTADLLGVLDIGGTKILGGVINRAGALLVRRCIETLPSRGAEDIIARCAALLQELAQEVQAPSHAISAVGCSVPGPLDSEKGMVIFSPNLAWHNVPLVKMLHDYLPVPIVIEDDARCAALGEARKGAAQGARNAVFVTFSTGIGSGVIIDGHIYRGSHGAAGEVGHITLVPDGPMCACGNNGCFEALASGSAIAAQARQAVLNGTKTVLTELVVHPNLLTAEQVMQAVALGDAVAIDIIETAGRYAGIGLAAVASAFDPEIIVVGGGVVRSHNLFLQCARETFQVRAIAPLNELVRIVPAALGDESGLWVLPLLLKAYCRGVFRVEKRKRMFEQVSTAMMQRAMHPEITYGRSILAHTLRRVLESHDASTYIILTQPEPWAIAREQFADMEGGQVIYLRSLEHDDLAAMEQALAPTDVIVGVGGGQALDTAKFVAWRRKIPLILAPTIVSVDAAVTNTIALREEQRVRYVGFVVADAIAVDLEVISQAPLSLNRAGIGDLLSIHTALWDWQYAGDMYDAAIAAQTTPILDELDARAGEIAVCSDEALRFIMESYVRENTLCLQAGSSRPEEGSEHYLGYNLEFITGHGYVHGQLICLCTYTMARLQQNRPERVLSIISRSQCRWRLSELAISHEQFIRALLTLQEYAEAEAFPASIISRCPITPTFAAQLARECDQLATAT